MQSVYRFFLFGILLANCQIFALSEDCKARLEYSQWYASQMSSPYYPLYIGKSDDAENECKSFAKLQVANNCVQWNEVAGIPENETEEHRICRINNTGLVYRSNPGGDPCGFGSPNACEIECQMGTNWYPGRMYYHRLYLGYDRIYQFFGYNCNEDTIPPPPECKCTGKDCNNACLFNTSAIAAAPVDGSCGGGCSNEAGPSSGEPVAIFSGNQYIDRTDMTFDAGTWELEIAPHFSAKYQAHTSHGFGWHSVLGMRLFRKESGGYAVRNASGLTQNYSAPSVANSYPALAKTSGNASSSEPLTIVTENGPIIYREGDRRYYFGSDGALDSITDGFGFGFKMLYEMEGSKKALAPIRGISTSAHPADFRAVITRDYRVTSIENIRLASAKITVNYDTAGYIQSLTDHQNRVVTYKYDHDSTLKVGRLIQVDGLEGSHQYHFESGRRYVISLWNASPAPLEQLNNQSEEASYVAMTKNTVADDGRVSSQITGERSFSWTVVSNTANSFESGDLTCKGRKTVVQQTITGSKPIIETLTDTAYSCISKSETNTGDPKVYQGGRQNSSLGSRNVDYGEGLITPVRPFPYPYVASQSTPTQIKLNLRDDSGLDTLTQEISKLGWKDTVFIHRKYDSEQRVIRETRGKRFANNGPYQEYNDSIAISTDYDELGRFWREVQWINPADSMQGSTIIRSVSYNLDGTISTEYNRGTTSIYDYSASTFPGKPSRVVKDGNVTTLFTYDDLGRIETETDPRGGVTYHWYTATGRDSILVTPARDTTFFFWEGGRLVRKMEHRKDMYRGRETQTAFDADGLDTATYWVKDGERFLLSRKKRDAFGRIIAEGDSLKALRRKIAYNDLGYETGDTVWSSTGTPLILKKYLDATGRDTAQLLANGDSVHIRLDGFGNKLATRYFVKVGNSRVQTTADSSVYDLNNQPLERYDSLSSGNWKKTTFFYDMQGNLKRSIGSRNETTLYGYGEAGKPLWSRDAVGKWMWHVYDSRGFDSLTVTLAKGHEPDTNAGVYTLQAGDWVHATRQDNAGNLRQVREGLWQASYSKAEDLTLVRAMGYYPSNRVQTDSIPVDINNQQWLVTQYEWFPTGELKKTSRTGGMVSEYGYNEKGQKIAELAINAQGGMDTTKAWTFDAAGRLVEERTPGLGGVIRTYDEAGRVTSVTDSSLVRTGLQLDNLGRVIADTNGIGYVAKHAYGPNADTLYDRNNAKTVVTRDALGRTTNIKDNEGNQTKFFYELKTDGTQRDSVAYPDGTWEVTVTDQGGRTIQKIDKRGITQRFVYGDDWTLNTVRYEMTEKPTLEVVYTRNDKGQVEKIERTEGGVTTAKTEYTFDDAGRVLSQKQTVGAEIKTTSYTYDMARRSVTLTLPDGTTRTKVLDDRGRLDSVYLDGAMVADYFYDKNKHTGTMLGNGMEASYGRDLSGRLTSMVYGKNGQDPILRHDLGWDVAGQLNWTKKIPDAIADERYGMDNQGQLTEWKTGALDASYEILTPVDSLGWAMDSKGNWVNVYDSKATIDTRTHSGANSINDRNGVTFTYDDAGNLLSDGVNTYEWTLDGLLAKVTLADGSMTLYTYDGQRRMVKREQKNSAGTIADASTYLWSGWQLDQEVRNNIPRTFAYGNYMDDQIAMKTAGSTYYFHRSYNQTTEAVTDASGNLVERYLETTPYGGYVIQDANENALITSTIGNRSVFQGAPMTDPMSGLVYLRNRWYSPQLGRFVSRDPMGMPEGVNRYMLEQNMPIEYTDPLGLCKCDLKSFSVTLTNVDKKRPGIEFVMYAEFIENTSTGSVASCCSFKQEAKGSMYMNGANLKTHTGCGEELSSNKWQDDCYGDRRKMFEKSRMDGGFDQYHWYSNNMDIMAYVGIDSPGLHPNTPGINGDTFDFDVQFRGQIIDKCNNNAVVQEKKYGYKVTGTMGGDFDVSTSGF